MKIVSTMGTGSLGRELDLKSLVTELEEYLDNSISINVTSSGMISTRFEKDGPAFTIYRTGSFQIRGAKTEERLNQAVERFYDALSDIGMAIPSFQFSHVTSVFLEDLGRDLDLEKLTVILGLENTEYEPEQFPGIIYRPSDYDVSLLVFSSGKVIVGGTADREKAEAAIRGLEEVITTVDE